MKFILSVAVVAILLNCHSRVDPTVKNFLPGLYARCVADEFSEGRDTLIVAQLDGDMYAIQHRMGYQRIVDGKKGSVETKVEQWSALYDETQNVLKETRRGRVLSFNAETKTLFVGSSAYQKLN